MDISTDYIIAEGPQGLTRVLEDLLAKSKQDTSFAKQAHYVLYQLGGQKTMLKIDMSQQPFLIWHHDLMGRPMTTVVKDTLTQFLKEKCGATEVFLQDVSQ